ncbi:metallophosphoesterase family protein [Saccharicrinis sp. FJH54]|uniref:metallophosphoesterase family protein n=1 Tax=Saccharicrinis sp. FJH54 TaxID=3344665 RepID=UPI0035D4FD67
MKKIGLISDTHGQIHSHVFDNFKGCDEIWHAGDIGSWQVISDLESIAPVRAVHGNIDGWEYRKKYPEVLRFKCEDVNVLMTHIGGYPGRYASGMKTMFTESPVDLFISGHSHILKVMYDDKFNLLHINPGAAGNSGFHQVRTLIRFVIDGKNIKDLEVIEMCKRG